MSWCKDMRTWERKRRHTEEEGPTGSAVAELCVPVCSVKRCFCKEKDDEEEGNMDFRRWNGSPASSCRKSEQSKGDIRADN